MDIRLPELNILRYRYLSLIVGCRRFLEGNQHLRSAFTHYLEIVVINCNDTGTRTHNKSVMGVTLHKCEKRSIQFNTANSDVLDGTLSNTRRAVNM